MSVEDLICPVAAGNVFLPCTIYRPRNWISPSHYATVTAASIHIDEYKLTRMPPVIFAHGLGSKNPKKKNHSNDEWGMFWSKLTMELDLCSVLYTARGHGSSYGWEDTILRDKEQFLWRRLASDMIDVADHFKFDRFIAAGSSMGSATSLFAAIQYPKYIRAVILIRPPTAWKERADRRKYLLGSAEKLRIKEMEKDPPTTYHEVLLSTSMSDLPPKDDLDSYNAIKCPVLILTIEGDDAHPVSTAVTLHSLLKTSTLEVASSQEEALKVWPDIIRKFITEINLL